MPGADFNQNTITKQKTYRPENVFKNSWFTRVNKFIQRTADLKLQDHLKQIAVRKPQISSPVFLFREEFIKKGNFFSIKKITNKKPFCKLLNHKLVSIKREKKCRRL